MSKVILNIENNSEKEFEFDPQELAMTVISAVLESENCPYDCEVGLTLTGNEEIRELNRTYRDIDKETDVLSFPNVDFEECALFSAVEENKADYMDPENDYLMLGDIVINTERVYSQALEYGHSTRREYAFLIAHSVLHLCGYDHMEEQEREVMEEKQEAVLKSLNITRD